ncbi:MAG TPA: vanadium-dependent haloperoxidase [Mucilaginibacter sp.]|nr:vanadium-dependent haloperoxidase [Mucilaginibacter sp.]
MKKSYSRYLYATVFASTILVVSCRKDKNENPANLSPAARTYSSEQIRNYFTLMCTVTKNTQGFFPTQAARAYAYVGVAAYEAVVNGIPGAKSLGGQLNGLPVLPSPDAGVAYNWAISSNAAIPEMMHKMFGSKLSQANSTTIDSTENANLAALSGGVDHAIVDRSVQYGKEVADAVYQASVSDGGDQSYLNPFHLPYTLPACDSCWVPTSPSTPMPISPEWGSLRPFMTANVSNVTFDQHTPFSTDPASKFYANAMGVYNQVKNNTAEQMAITQFWADDPFKTCTPAGHTFNIMVQLLKENNATLEKASVAFAKLSIAENDAFISCWKCKYQYNLIRPVSFIKKYIDAGFSTVIGTPAFPSYSSGHAYESGAASMVFINMFADANGNYDFTDDSQLQYGYAARHYSNFNDMAQECANSRFYGGIHYNEDNQEGLKMGREIGDNVNKLLQWPSNIK